MKRLTKTQTDMIMKLNTLTTENHPNRVYIPAYKYKEMFGMKYSNLMMILEQLEELNYITIKHFGQPGIYVPCQITLLNNALNFSELLQAEQTKRILAVIGCVLSSVIVAVILHMLGLRD